MTVLKCMCVLVFVCIGYQSVHWWLTSSEQFLHKLLGDWFTYTMVLEIKPLCLNHRFLNWQNWPYIREELMYGFLGVTHG